MYVVLFVLLYPTKGGSVAALSVLPVIVAGWYFGLRAALLSSIFVFLLNSLLIYEVGGISWTETLRHSGSGSLAVFVVGVVVGRLHDLGRELKRELMERQRAEAALRQHRDQLEARVAERTRELQTANTQLQQEISERQQIEVELRKALEKEHELNELKARFTSSVSHEFRTPLTVIQMTAEVLKLYNRKLNEEKRLEYLDKIDTQVNHLITMLDNILTISRSESLKSTFDPQRIDLYSFCHKCTEDFQFVARSHQLHFTADEGEPFAWIDPRLMQEALMNLLSNATKYSPKGSTVHIKLCHDGEQVRISVRDEGIGIPEQDQRNLFEMFYRANNVGSIQGTGLGLTIVKQAVEAHKGSIEVESTVGVGTAFTMTLPVSVQPSIAPA